MESTSIHYLKTKMCVGCSRGFEIVDLESLDTQGLLDPNDESLEFVRKRENLRPMAIYRIHNEFLLCYDGASALCLASVPPLIILSLKSLPSTSTKMAGDQERNSWYTGKVYPPGSVSSLLALT